MDNPRDDMVVIENDDGNRFEELRFAPDLLPFLAKFTCLYFQRSWRLTSGVQRTVLPLNSELSNFSTATFRSAAVSNSTKL